MKTRITILFPLLPFFLFSCSPESHDSKPQQRNKRPTGNYSGHLVAKPIGEATGPGELYLRLSMGDFFIKFSESGISRDELENRVGEVITVEGEIRTGNWDIGSEDPSEMQSRTGEYFVITKLL